MFTKVELAFSVLSLPLSELEAAPVVPVEFDPEELEVGKATLPEILKRYFTLCLNLKSRKQNFAYFWVSMWLPFYVFLLYVYNAEVLDLTEWTRLKKRWRHLRKMRSTFSLEAA